MTWQPEPDQTWPDLPGGKGGLAPPGSETGLAPPGSESGQAPPGSESGQAPPGVQSGLAPPGTVSEAAARSPGRWRRRGRLTAFGALLTAGLIGLAVSAVGIAHQLLPRQFTAGQQRAISAWEVGRRWRSEPAGAIFPASVQYYLLPGSLNATSGLTLHARLLGISPDTSCASAASGVAMRILREHGCSAALRATYVDASGSLVATVAVAVLPSSAAARTVVSQLLRGDTTSPALVRVLSVARSPAAGFGAAERQLSYATSGESYVIMATAGFTDDRHRVHLPASDYQYGELTSLAYGLADKAKSELGGRPATPACPEAPGC